MPSGNCAVCGQHNSNWCSRCQSIFYCSPQHQQADWPRHKLECVAPNTLNPAPPAQTASGNSSSQHHPTQTASQPAVPKLRPPIDPVLSYDALYFPQDATEGRIVTVECMPPAKDSASDCPDPFVAPFIRTSAPANKVLWVDRNRLLKQPLQIWYIPGSSTPNRSIAHMLSSNLCGQAPRPWMGDVLVMKYYNEQCRDYTDVSHDVPAIAAFFLNHA